MKNVCLLILLLTALEASAQGVFSNHTNAAIEKVIQDYPNQFKNIRGALLLQNQHTADYNSIIQIPGAISCIVVKPNSSKTDAVYWKAELLETNSFNEARSKYKELYNQIRNSIVRIRGEKPYILSGQYEMPVEKKRFQTVVFNMLPSVGEMRKLKVQLLLLRQGSSWKLSVIVFDREDITGTEQAMSW
ncbi:MAG TPA: hypothetical protein VGD17_02770 [Chitinophagaceae bacterium]